MVKTEASGLRVLKIEPIQQKKKRKLKQSKLKLQKIAYGSDVFISFFTQLYGLVRFAILILPTKLNPNIRKTLIIYIYIYN